MAKKLGSLAPDILTFLPMVFVETPTKPTRIALARFQSAYGLAQWLAENPRFRDCGRIVMQKRFSGEVCCALAEYASPEDCARAQAEAKQADREARNTYQRVRRAEGAPVNLTLEELRAERLRVRRAEQEAKRKERLRKKWAQLAKTPAGRRQLADWRAEALENDLPDVPPEIEPEPTGSDVV